MGILETIEKYCRLEGIRFSHYVDFVEGTVTMTSSYNCNVTNLRINIGTYYPIKMIDNMIDKMIKVKHGGNNGKL